VGVFHKIFVRLPALPYFLGLISPILYASDFILLALLGAVCSVGSTLFSCRPRVSFVLVILMLLLGGVWRLNVSQCILQGHEVFQRFKRASMPVSIDQGVVRKVIKITDIYRVELEIQGEAEIIGSGKLPAKSRVQLNTREKVYTGDVLSVDGVTRPPYVYTNFGTLNKPMKPLIQGVSGALWGTECHVKRRRHVQKQLIDIRELILSRVLSDLQRGCKESDAAYHLVPALLLGHKSETTESWVAPFRSIGAQHMLVVSGMHLSFVILICWALGYLLPISYHKILCGTVILSWIYVGLTGGAPPIIRASLFYTVFSLARFFHLRTNALNTLLVALIFVVAFDPFALYDVGVWLSFMVVFSLLVGVPPLTQFCSGLIKPDSFIPRQLWTARQLLQWKTARWLLAFPIVATIAWGMSSCITVWTFREVYLLGVLTSLALLPLVASMMLCSSLVVFLSFVHPTIAFPLRVLNKGIAHTTYKVASHWSTFDGIVVGSQRDAYVDALTVMHLPKGAECLVLAHGSEAFLIDYGGRSFKNSVYSILKGQNIQVKDILITHRDKNTSELRDLYPRADSTLLYTQDNYQKTFGPWEIESMTLSVRGSRRSNDTVALVRLSNLGHRVTYISDASYNVLQELKDSHLEWDCDILITGSSEEDDATLQEFACHLGASEIIIGASYYFRERSGGSHLTLYDQRLCGAVRLRPNKKGVEITPFIK